MFFPYRFETVTKCLLRPLGVRPDRDGVRVDADRLVATFGPLHVSVERANITSAQATGPYRFITAIGPRLSFADHGLTFGTTTRGGVCIVFDEAIRRVIGPWDHPGLSLTVEDREGLLDALGFSGPDRAKSS